VSLILNILWIIFGGLPMALGWLVAFGITIVGLPFAWAHLKLARLNLAPVGKVVRPL